MNIPGFSTSGLKMMQDAIRKALEHDDAIPNGQDKTYGVREFADWRELGDGFEAELDQRSETYTQIAW